MKFLLTLLGKRLYFVSVRNNSYIKNVIKYPGKDIQKTLLQKLYN